MCWTGRLLLGTLVALFSYLGLTKALVCRTFSSLARVSSHGSHSPRARVPSSPFQRREMPDGSVRRRSKYFLDLFCFHPIMLYAYGNQNSQLCYIAPLL